VFALRHTAVAGRVARSVGDCLLECFVQDGYAPGVPVAHLLNSVGELLCELFGLDDAVSTLLVALVEKLLLEHHAAYFLGFHLLLNEGHDLLLPLSIELNLLLVHEHFSFFL